MKTDPVKNRNTKQTSDLKVHKGISYECKRDLKQLDRNLNTCKRTQFLFNKILSVHSIIRIR